LEIFNPSQSASTTDSIVIITMCHTTLCRWQPGWASQVVSGNVFWYRRFAVAV